MVVCKGVERPEDGDLDTGTGMKNDWDFLAYV